MSNYDPKTIEAKWQKAWQKKDLFKSEINDKDKKYILVEFPYPSGDGLHVGHCRSFTALDAYCRKLRLQDKNVLYPMGWDAFGLPTENYAIKNKIKPQVATEKNIATFKNQMNSLGFSFDWSREINTTDPAYYKWTQWIFLQFYKHKHENGKVVAVANDDKSAKRLAYQAEMPINWCPSCKIGLANEEVIDGKCERCGAETIKKMQKQWMMRITDYADRLIDDLETVDYLPKIKTGQINWIGRSTGSNIKFPVIFTSPSVIPAKAGIQTNLDPRIKSEDDEEVFIEVFTTRADTLYGCTYVVVAPESKYIENLKFKISNLKDVENYISESKKKSDLERTDLAKDKTGVKIEGVKAINPINGKEIDIFVADYVLANYGTGAVMAVPAHDERDYEFAKKYGIEIIYVVEPKFVATKDSDAAIKKELPLEKRRAICAVVKNPKNNKYLCISWKNFKMHGLITGGIDDGEDIIKCAEREILEETGYKNLKYIRTAPLGINTQFYHRQKKVNRWAHFQFVFFDLVDENRSEIAENESALHDVVWKSEDELKDFFTVFEGQYLSDLIKNGDSAFTDYGILIGSNEFSGLDSEIAKTKITEKLKTDGLGDFTVNYKLRDWIFSRQHYWGEPIPIIHCPKCGAVPVPEKDLPVELPDVENYQPTDTGESPLAKITDWVNVKCPNCGSDAKRETDTMPNWAGSSWYFLRYCDPKNDQEFASNKNLKYYTPVDVYNGGMEHTTLHLLYSRFWHKFLYDLGKVPTLEPYHKRISHGMILGPDNQKMSKSRGNVINPDSIVEKYGADTLRTYMLFIGPYDDVAVWNPSSISGVNRFLKRFYLISNLLSDSEPKIITRQINKAIKKLTEDFDSFHFNTTVSTIMETFNLISKEAKITITSLEKLLIIFYPIAPHICEEIWQNSNGSGLIAEKSWPSFDSKLISEEKITIPIQINGKVRDQIVVDVNISEEEISKIALESEKIKNLISTEPKKIIYIKGKIINIVS